MKENLLTQLKFMAAATDARALRNANKILAVFEGLLLLFLLYSVIWVSPKRSFQETLTKAAQDKEGISREMKDLEKSLSPAKEPLESYVSAVSGKNIFGAAPAGPAGSGPSAKAEGALGDMVLVGIMPGENAKAIFEDKTQQMTYYLSKNDALGDAVVEEIKEKSVVLKQKGKTITFSL